MFPQMSWMINLSKRKDEIHGMSNKSQCIFKISCIYLFFGSKKLRATWEFVKFLISPESQAYWNAQTGYFPVTTKSQDEQTFKDNIAQYPQFQTAIDQLHDSSPKYCGALLSVFPEARATVESEIESMLNGKEDVDTAVQKMSDTINKSIKDYNTVNN